MQISSLLSLYPGQKTNAVQRFEAQTTEISNSRAQDSVSISDAAKQAARAANIAGIDWNQFVNHDTGYLDHSRLSSHLQQKYADQPYVVEVPEQYMSATLNGEKRTFTAFGLGANLQNKWDQATAHLSASISDELQFNTFFSPSIGWQSLQETYHGSKPFDIAQFLNGKALDQDILDRLLTDTPTNI